MSRTPRGDRYHHGDLRAALIDTSVELIAERGVRNFSLAEASRRLGVAVSAPYAHFRDRDGLLAAIAVRAYEVLGAELLGATAAVPDPAGRLAAMAGSYVRYAAGHRALFEVLSQLSLDKARHPEIAAAERPLDEAIAACVAALTGDGQPAWADDLATAIEATAHGHAVLLLDGAFGDGPGAVATAADRAARATLALVAGRSALGPAS